MRRFFVLLAVAMACLAFAAQAGASDTTVVSLSECAHGDGTATVQPGTPITLQNFGYDQGTLGLLNDFLIKQRTTLAVSDGTSTVYDLTRQWEAPQQLDKHLWGTQLPDTETGTALLPGQSMVATFDITFSQRLLVAFPPVGPSGNNGPFLISEEGPISCVITGATS